MPNRSMQVGRLHFHHTLLDWLGQWPLGILVHRRRILFVNEVAAHLLGGQRRRDLIGRHIGTVYRPESFSPFSRPSYRGALLRRLDGERVPCDLLSFNVPMLQRGATVMFLCPASGEAERGTASLFVDRFQTNDLTKSKIDNSVLVVKNKVSLRPLETNQPMVGTKLIDLNPPAPERAKRAVQQVYMHHCAMCQGDWVGYDAGPAVCIYCHSRRWRNGKSKWDERREYDEMVNDHPYDRQAVLDLLRDRDRGLTAFEVLRALELPHSRYDAVRRTLIRMMRDAQLVRIGRGRYAAPSVE